MEWALTAIDPEVRELFVVCYTPYGRTGGAFSFAFPFIFFDLFRDMVSWRGNTGVLSPFITCTLWIGALLRFFEVVEIVGGGFSENVFS